MQILFHIHRHAAYGSHIVLTGSTDFLGAWDVKRAVHCKWSTGDVWRAQVDYHPQHAAPSRFEFKFALAKGNNHDPEIVEWEPNANHAVSVPAVLPGRTYPAPIVVETHWGASTELDLRALPQSWRSQSPPPTPASVAGLDDGDEEKLRNAVARLAVSRGDSPTLPAMSSSSGSGSTAANGISHDTSTSAQTASAASNELLRVQFRIKYRVADGERIYVLGGIKELGGWNKMHAPRLVQPSTSDCVIESGLWVLDMHIPRDDAHSKFEYKYFTRKWDGRRRWERGGNRLACPFESSAPSTDGKVIWDDRWEKIRFDFSIYYPTKATETMHVTGDPAEIGAWFRPGPTPMKLGSELTLETDVKGRKWELSVWVDPELKPFPYRYIVIDSASKKQLWEREPNRQAKFDPLEQVVNGVHILRDVNFVSGFLFDHVPPNMVIGPYPQSIEDVDALHETGVTAVFNTQTDEDFVHRGIQWDSLMKQYNKHSIKVVRYQIKDFDRLSLRKRLQGAAAALDELISAGKVVYIHCTAGMGRAPACAVAYLCLVQNWSLDDAVTHVKKHRLVAVPNVPVLEDVLKSVGHTAKPCAVNATLSRR